MALEQPSDETPHLSLPDGEVNQQYRADFLPSEARQLPTITPALEQAVEQPLNVVVSNILVAQQNITLFKASVVLIGYSIGLQLWEIKRSLQHGEFNQWIEDHLAPGGLKLRTAQRYMKLVEDFPLILDAICNQHHNTTGLVLSCDQAISIVKGMSLASANSLLRKPVKNRVEPDREFHKKVILLAKNFYGHKLQKRTRLGNKRYTTCVTYSFSPDISMVNSKWGDDQLIIPAQHGHNETVIDQALERFEADSITRQILLLNDQGSRKWLPKIDPFSRVVCRMPSASGNNQIQRVVLIADTDAVEHFASTFTRLGSIFVPFFPSSH